MSKNKNKKPPYIHPQQKSLEHAGLLLKRFIEDIRHDRMFAHRIFYPVLYRNEISKPIVNKENKIVATTLETEIEYYLLKAEEYATNGAVLVAMMLANGPMVSKSLRIPISEFCNRAYHKTIVARTKAFLDILRDDNMFNFVFYALTSSNTQDQDVERMRERFTEVVKIIERREKSKLPAAHEVVISRDVAKNREYLLKHFQHISEKDIVQTLNFISYMCSSSTIVTDFNYRPVSNETITELLNYGSEEVQKDLLLSKLEKMLTDKNYDTVASDQITYLIEIMYRDYASLVSRSNRRPQQHFIIGQIGRNELDPHTHNVIKLRLSKSAQKIHEYTKRYLSSVLSRALSAHESFTSSGRYIDSLIEMLIQYAAAGDNTLKAKIYGHISNPHAFLGECQNNCSSVNDASLCCLIYSIIKNDVEYLRSYATTSSANLISSVEPTQEKINDFVTLIDNFTQNVKDLINSGSRSYIVGQYIERTRSDITQNVPAISHEMATDVLLQMSEYAFDSNSIMADGNKVLANIEKDFQSYIDQKETSVISQFFKRMSRKLNNIFSVSVFKRDLLSIVSDVLKSGGYMDGLSEADKAKILRVFSDIANDIVRLRQIYMSLYVQQILLHDKIKDLLMQYNAIDSAAKSRTVGVVYSQIIKEKIDIARQLLFYKNYVLKINNGLHDNIQEISRSRYFKRINNVFKDVLTNSLRYPAIIEALNNLNFDRQGEIELPKIIDSLGEDAIVRTVLQHYFQHYLQPILHELVSSAFEEDIVARIQVNDHLLTKDVLNLSHYLTPSVVGTITFDANVFNDLAYYTYVFMGDTFAGLTRSNVDSVMKFLDEIYGIRYFNIVIMGANDVFLYLNYVGIPALYRGAKTKLRRSDLENNYKWMTDARDGLYKYVQLPRKRK